jgi:polyisoprenoid-binding protein YceI
MRIFIRIIATFTLLLLPTLSPASSWQIDSDHTSVQFKVRHLMISNVKGVFHKFKGMVEADDKDITMSKVNITIDMASVDTGVAMRDADLRSDNFFNVAKYPTMTFVSKKILNQGAGNLKLIGDLTIHGITKEVTLDVEGPSEAIKDPWGNMRRGATATTKINRKDFGLTWNKVMETGGLVVGDEITINLDIELVRK